MKTFILSLLDWIYKKKCYFCGTSKESSKMCSTCYDELDYMPILVSRDLMGVSVYCAGTYDKNLQKLIRGLKYHRQKDLAYFQAKFMYEYWKKISDKKDFCTIIPVPLFKAREKSRKYNHMALVANEFAKLTGYSVDLEIVKRIKDTRPQYKLNKSQRMDNLSNAFEINKKVSGPILLIDDICTTGATFENIIIELKKNGMNDIVCLATTTPFAENSLNV